MHECRCRESLPSTWSVVEGVRSVDLDVTLVALILLYSFLRKTSFLAVTGAPVMMVVSITILFHPASM